MGLKGGARLPGLANNHQPRAPRLVSPTRKQAKAMASTRMSRPSPSSSGNGMATSNLEVTRMAPIIRTPLKIPSAP